MPRHLDRTGSMTLDWLLQHRMRRQLALHFSMVSRQAQANLVVDLVLAPAGRLGGTALGAIGSAALAASAERRGGAGNVPVGRHLLDDLLHDVAVVDAGVSGADLDVVVGADHVDLDGPLGRGGEGPLVEAEALGSRAVDLAEEGHDPRLLPGAGGSVKHEVGRGGSGGRPPAIGDGRSSPVGTTAA